MTKDILTAAGEEFAIKNALDGQTLTIGLYDDTVDGITDQDYDPATAITTEPGNTNYARESIAFSAAQTATDVWGVQNDSALSFDFSDTAAADEVDAAFIMANFNSVYAGGTGDWIIATAALVNTHEIGNVNSVDIAIGDGEINFS